MPNDDHDGFLSDLSARVADLKSILLLIAAVSFTSLQVGCGTTQPASVKSRYENPHVVAYNNAQGPITGTFIVTYIPLLFSEPKDLREARHNQIAGLIALHLQDKGLRLAIGDEPIDYEISYSYSRSPDFQSGYNHTMEIRIERWPMSSGHLAAAKNPKLALWTGSYYYDRWPDADTSELFMNMVQGILAVFPDGTIDSKRPTDGPALQQPL